MRKNVTLITLIAITFLTTSLSSVFAADSKSTAFDLIEAGNRFLSEDAKGRILDLKSEKSVGTMTPNIWYIRYFDPDATAKTTEVKFGAGRKLGVKRPLRITFSKPREMNREKLKIDSDKAIKLAQAEPLLDNLTIVSVQLWLSAKDDPDSPEWKVRFWAEKLRDKTKSVNIGDIYLSAETGKITRTKLKIKRVD